MWTIAAVNKKIDGPLGSYNGLTDIHLAHYFSKPSQQSHLKALKLPVRNGDLLTYGDPIIVQKLLEDGMSLKLLILLL
ncbi:uncharacterized protein TNIN_397781 [Trichonephila inaurata madagascariensis]|uniref:Uncharacterized protein n=1 Tax=Trichonephila inaurata madagascariensis TaxID=2747483 RepID=A0A8X6M9P2_9ARAC|nr:uncharacterized protein TNIN_397781 [Trichonephila inaurata madagascariensis]